jgi:hypothetical protein
VDVGENLIERGTEAGALVIRRDHDAVGRVQVGLCSGFAIVIVLCKARVTETSGLEIRDCDHGG